MEIQEGVVTCRVGSDVGSRDGWEVGRRVGCREGCDEGVLDGWVVGCTVGFPEGCEKSSV